MLKWLPIALRRESNISAQSSVGPLLSASFTTDPLMIFKSATTS